jgi:histidine triad (HIT) family protein
MPKSSECIFCKIVNDEVPSTKVYEDDYVLAFLSNAPVEKGHTLVVPKEHVRNILDCPANILGYTMAIVQKIAQDQIKNGAKAVRIIQNNEKPLQEVFHLHFHVIPYGDKK